MPSTPRRRSPGRACWQSSTAADIPGRNDVGTLGPEPVLADGQVHCVGQPFALVVAETPDAAREAAGLVTADWTPLPAVVDAADATELIGPVRTLACGNAVDDVWPSCAGGPAGTVALGSATTTPPWRRIVHWRCPPRMGC